MSYRDKIKVEVEIISKSNTQISKEIRQILEKIYSQALEDNKKTGQSVESLTYEILEGIEEGLRVKDEQTEEILKTVADTITEIIHKSVTKNIQKSHTNAHIAQERLKDVIELEKTHLLESMDAFKAYAEDRSYKVFAKSLHKTETKIAKLIHTIANKIQRYKIE